MIEMKESQARQLGPGCCWAAWANGVQKPHRGEATSEDLQEATHQAGASASRAVTHAGRTFGTFGTLLFISGQRKGHACERLQV